MRTKLLAGAFVAVCLGGLYAFPFFVPPGDREFVQGLLLFTGAVCLFMISMAEVVYCPNCGVDTGRFYRLAHTGEGSTCRKCGHRIEGGDEVGL